MAPSSDDSDIEHATWWANARDVITFALGVTGFIYEMLRAEARTVFLVCCLGMMGLGKMLEVIARVLEALVAWRGPDGPA